jgi:hypothetical protein
MDKRLKDEESTPDYLMFSVFPQEVSGVVKNLHHVTDYHVS